MYKVKLRKTNIERRKLRVRKKVFGTSEVPRLTVFRSNKYIYGQLIDDSKGVTLVSTGKEVAKIHSEKTKTEAAFELGKELGRKAVEKGIFTIVFDRNGYIYHGRVKSFADGARKGGLKF